MSSDLHTQAYVSLSSPQRERSAGWASGNPPGGKAGLVLLWGLHWRGAGSRGGGRVERFLGTCSLHLAVTFGRSWVASVPRGAHLRLCRAGVEGTWGGGWAVLHSGSETGVFSQKGRAKDGAVSWHPGELGLPELVPRVTR